MMVPPTACQADAGACGRGLKRDASRRVKAGLPRGADQADAGARGLVEVGKEGRLREAWPRRGAV
jgi:hypothetical protein